MSKTSLSTRVPLIPVPRSQFAFVLLVAAASCGRIAQGALPHETPAVPIRVETVNPEGAVTITASGTLGAKDEVPLAFKVGGVVLRVNVDEGAQVHAGDVLAELDLREIDAAVAKANAGAEKAGRDAARVERLYHDSVATLAQWQDVQTVRDVAQADLRSAQMNRDYAVITAPADGVVLQRLVNGGAQIAAGSKVLVLGSAARGAVFRAGLADRDAVRVRVGNSAVATFDALPGREFHGRVRQIGADADPHTGTYAVEVALDDVAGLPNGLMGRARIGAAATASSNAGAVAIPAEALVEGDGTVGIVFGVDSAKHVAIRHRVTLVGVDGDRVLVRGLVGVGAVVTTGAAWLKDSTRVEIQR